MSHAATGVDPETKQGRSRLAIGCLVVGGLVIVAAGILAIAVPSTWSALGGSDDGFGYEQASCLVFTDADGSRRAVVRIEITEGWWLAEILGVEAQRSVEGKVRPVTLRSTLPSPPVESGFDLEFELPPADASADGSAPPSEQLRVELHVRAHSGFLGHHRIQSRLPKSWEIGAESLEPLSR